GAAAARKDRMSSLLARLRRGGRRSSVVAPLNSTLVLAVGRRVPKDAGRGRASTTIGRWAGRRTVSVCELTGEVGDERPSTTVLAEMLKDLVPRLHGNERSELLD